MPMLEENTFDLLSKTGEWTIEYNTPLFEKATIEIKKEGDKFICKHSRSDTPKICYNLYQLALYLEFVGYFDEAITGYFIDPDKIHLIKTDKGLLPKSLYQGG